MADLRPNTQDFIDALEAPVYVEDADGIAVLSRRQLAAEAGMSVQQMTDAMRALGGLGLTDDQAATMIHQLVVPPHPGRRPWWRRILRKG